MKTVLHNLRILGIVLFLCRRWLEVLYWPSLILIALPSLGLLYYWRENKRSDNIWNIVIIIAAVLAMIGL
ncbi:MAG: hypothetical protein J6Y04_05845 [Bacteroidaceae bacterium]|nr:hypothetical protein [Bacteroidaceae bacterium]